MATPRDRARQPTSLVVAARAGRARARARAKLAPLPELRRAARHKRPRAPEVAERLARALVDEPSPLLKDGGVIRRSGSPRSPRSGEVRDAAARRGKDEVLESRSAQQKDCGINDPQGPLQPRVGYEIEIPKTPGRSA